MTSDSMSELIVVRSLTESDLGIFAAHRAFATSKQRAININSSIARQLLSTPLFEQGGGQIDCICIFGSTRIEGPRHFGKIHKNWRLGGPKIEGKAFADLDSKDFVLLRSVAANDGTHPITITFVSRKTDRVVHAGLVAIVEKVLDRSMVSYDEGTPGFNDLARYCSVLRSERTIEPAIEPIAVVQRRPEKPSKPIPAMPRQEAPSKKRTIREKVRAPHILERMLQVAGDLSAPAQLRFMETVEQLATQLRKILLETGGITQIEKSHANLWKQVSGKHIAFVDGGLANLSMLGSAPVAARVGGYVVTPGERGPSRERFTVLKHLIDELYTHSDGGVYKEAFPDIGALRDAARISIEAAGAVRLVTEQPSLSWTMVHGALVNPVSRYTDVMRDGRVQHPFPDFSEKSLVDLLPVGDRPKTHRPSNFVSVYLRQLQLLSAARGVVCGVIEREATTTSVCRAVLDSLDDDVIQELLPTPAAEWKKWFRNAIDPFDDDENEGQRITDSLLFRCVLEPGEALVPVPIDRNEMRRAPEAWKPVIVDYPKPIVSYLQATEWSSPIRIELFSKDKQRFTETASLILHCALLLPRYAFPVGLDIVDKFARIPNWMSRPVNTHTAVQVMKRALEEEDTKLFDSLRRMLCGSTREWLLRPGAGR